MLIFATVWFVVVGGTGTGTETAPFGTIQAALDVAQPGDTIQVDGGLYAESLVTKRDGSAAAPIELVGVEGGAVVTLAGRALTLAHAHYIFGGFRFDGQYADDNTVRIENGATNTVFREVLIQHSKRDCVAIDSPAGVTFERARITKCLNPMNGRTDAHGIAAVGVTDLVLREVTIDRVSGDAIHLEGPWNRVLLQKLTLSGTPSLDAEGGFPAGALTAVNGLVAKAPVQAFVTLSELAIFGFRNGVGIDISGGVAANLDRVTVTGSKTGLGFRGAAQIVATNVLLDELTTGVRYEDDLVAPQLYSSTFGRMVQKPFEAVASSDTTFDAKNVLVMANRLPSELSATNGCLAVEDPHLFRNEYEPLPANPALDGGVPVVVNFDRVGHPRPQGAAHDVGAIEVCPNGSCLSNNGDGRAVADSTGCCEAGRAQPWPALLLVALWLRGSRRRPRAVNS